MRSTIISTTSDHISSGGTITGDLTISGDLTVSGGGTTFAYNEVVTGDMSITLTSTATSNALFIDHNMSGDAATNGTAFYIDFDRTVATGSTNAHNDIGINLDVNSASLGTSSVIGMDIDVVGASSGTSTATGLTVDVGSADTNYAALFNGGNVGIGTTTPSSDLEISKNSTADGAAERLLTLTGIDSGGGDQQVGDGVGILFRIPSDATTKIGASIDAVKQAGSDADSSTDLVFSTSQDDETLDEAMRISESGNVGIGTAAPSMKLTVDNNANTDAVIIHGANDSLGLVLGYNSGGDTSAWIANNYGSSGGTVEIRVDGTAASNAKMVLDTNSRISLGNNDLGGSDNTIFGYEAALDIVSGMTGHTVFGYEAMEDIAHADCDQNTAIGYRALQGSGTNTANRSANSTAVGANALKSSSTGFRNTALGAEAGSALTTACDTVIIGKSAGAGVMITNSGGSVPSYADGTVAVGYSALTALTSGERNLAVGYSAGAATTIGHENTAVGYEALLTNVHGDGNTAIGNQALRVLAPSDGDGKNVAVGTDAGKLLTAGNSNVLVGAFSLQSANLTESYNVAIGEQAMASVDEGSGGDADNNVAIGYRALIGGDFGTASKSLKENIAIGSNALAGTLTNAQTGTVAIGHSALTALTTGASNTAVGYQVMAETTQGEKNTVVGYQAMAEDATLANTNNTFFGYQAGGGDWTTGASTYNVGIGSRALYGAMNDADYNVAIGSEAGIAVVGGEHNTMVGNTAGNVITSGTQNTIIGSAADPSANSGTNQTVVGYATTGQADNSVTLGNASVNDVYMAQDKEAIGHLGVVNLHDGKDRVNTMTLDGLGDTNGGSIEFVVSTSGTIAVNDTMVFTYAASTWKSYMLEISLASAGGSAFWKSGGYNNSNNTNPTVYEVGDSITAGTLVLTNSGQSVVGTLTFNAEHAHNQFLIKYTQGGGDGVPSMSNVSVVFNIA